MQMSDTQEFALKYWLAACPQEQGMFPARSSMKITDLRSRMSQIGILDIEHNPLDFRYRLIGTWLRTFLHDDYTGQSLRELDGKGPDSKIWSILESVYREQDPIYCAVPYVGPKSDYKQASSLYLPLADDNKTINKIMLVANFELIEQSAYDSNFDPLETRFVPPEWRNRRV